MEHDKGKMLLRSIRIERRHIGYVKWLLESHDGMATINRKVIVTGYPVTIIFLADAPKPSIFPADAPKPSIFPADAPKPSIFPVDAPKPSTPHNCTLSADIQ